MAAVMERIGTPVPPLFPLGSDPMGPITLPPETDEHRAGRVIRGRGTSEASWRACSHLGTLPAVTLEALVPAGRRAVVVSPHPDDEVLGAGGLMAQLAQAGRELLIMPVTDGTASHPGSSRWTPDRLAQERPLETVRALALLGLSRIRLHRLGLHDGQLTAQQDQMVSALLTQLRPGDVVITTWREDGHPDHEATGHACAAAAEQAGAQLIEMPVWAWHWARPGDPRLPWSRACRLPLSPDVEQRKRLAAAAFTSQTRPDPTSRAGCVLPPSALARVLRPYEVFFR